MDTLTYPAPGTDPAGRVTDPRVDRPCLTSMRDTARALCLSERTVFTLVRQGKLRPVRIGSRVLFDAVDIRAFIDASKA